MRNTRKPFRGSGREHRHKGRAQALSEDRLNTTIVTFSIILKHGTPPHIKGSHSRREALNLLKPSDDVVDLVRAFADAYYLKVVDVKPAHRKIILSGTLMQIQEAFNIKFHLHPHHDGEYLSYDGELYLPEVLHEHILGIMGLHFKPDIKPKAMLTPKTTPRTEGARETGEFFNNYPTILSRLYEFPTDLDGAGQKIALLQLGGGYLMSDMDAYFKLLDLQTPMIKDISVNGGSNNPMPGGDPKTNEVYSDIYMAGAVANKAELLIYFANDNHLHVLMEVFQEAVYDEINCPDIISSSWGSSEKAWNANDIAILESVLEDAARLKITVFAASGDNGAGNGLPGINVDYPASSPWVTGCGGTVAMVNASYTQILEEVTWNGQDGHGGATGGGVSNMFKLPDWQKRSGVPDNASTGRPGRGVPDISGVAGFYKILMFNSPTQTGGTSCVAPFYAGLMALANQKAGTAIGYINDLIYSVDNTRRSTMFCDITSGNNGNYHCTQGWDPCTGWGRLYGARFVDVLADLVNNRKESDN